MILATRALRLTLNKSWGCWTGSGHDLSVIRLHCSKYRLNLKSFSRNNFSRDSFDQEGIKRIRNVGIIAHIDAGKTTTTERMLFLTGKTTFLGNVDSGDTVTDFMIQERERGITIQSAAISMDWGPYNISLIDTPGHVDFTMEVERAVRVLDGAAVVVDAVAGVQAQTATVWRQAERHGVPAVAFVNKLDREGACLDRALESLARRLGARPAPLQRPLRDPATGRLLGLLDLLTLEAVEWDFAGQSPKRSAGEVVRTPLRPLLLPGGGGGGGGGTATAGGVDLGPAAAEALEHRHNLLETLADFDDQIMEAVLEGNEDSITVPQILSVLKKATLERRLLPVFCGSALQGIGCEQLLDGIVALLPSPDERPYPIGRLPSGEEVPVPLDGEDLCALAFKVSAHPQRGALVFLRVYSGTLRPRETLVVNSAGGPGAGAKERPTQILQVQADDLRMVEAAGPGAVVAAVGLKEARTGDTLMAAGGGGGPKAAAGGAVQRRRRRLPAGLRLAGVAVPAPVFALAVEAASAKDQPRLEAALGILTREDPSLAVDADGEGGQTLLRGVGELHLEIVCDRLRREFGVEVETGRCYVAYREAVRAPFALEHAYEATFGGRRMFASLSLSIDPVGSTGSGSLGGGGGEEAPYRATSELVFEVAKEVEEQLSPEELQSLRAGLRDAAAKGPVGGYPLADATVRVLAAGRDGDTSPAALRAAAVTGVAALARGAHPALMEPVMRAEISAPGEHLGAVLSDLTAGRRANVRRVEGPPGAGAGWAAGGGGGVGGGGGGGRAPPDQQVVVADVPLSSMLGYATVIRSLTRGEGSFSAEYSHHEVMPLDEQEKALSRWSY